MNKIGLKLHTQNHRIKSHLIKNEKRKRSFYGTERRS